jgi:hypothetical protein
VPDGPLCLVRKERKAWLSRLISKHSGHQARLIIAREGQAFDAQNGIHLIWARFDNSHDARVFS